MFYLQLILLMLASALSFAQSPVNTDPNCVFNPHDPFEPRSRMSHGPEKGLCINSQWRRSARELNGSEAARYFGQRDGSIVVANFSHQKKFWVAQIPVKKITRMILQTQYFPQGPEILGIEISHVQFRFDFAPGAKIELISQDSSESVRKISVKHALLSVENIGPHGEKFDFVRGFKGYFNLVYRLVSLEDKYDWMVRLQGHRVTQHLVKVTPKNAQKIFMNGVMKGTIRGSRTPYHSIKQSCSTELVKILRDALGTRDSLLSFHPNEVLEIMKRRGLIAGELPTLNEEARQSPGQYRR